jgi:hypothetical protein
MRGKGYDARRDAIESDILRLVPVEDSDQAFEILTCQYLETSAAGIG